MKTGWKKIIGVAIVCFTFGSAVNLTSPSTVTIAEAGKTDRSWQTTDPVPDISVSPQQYDWGDLWVGFSDALEVTIANAGSDIINITGMTISDMENYSLKLKGGIDPCGDLPITLEAGTSCTCLVIFHPQYEAAFSAVLSVECDDPGTPTADIILSGTGVPNDFPFGGVNYSVDIDSGCSIVPTKGSGTDGMMAYGWMIPLLLWFGIRRKRKERGSATDAK